MVILKACPRCRGDLNSDRDIYGEYLECVQCGYIQDRDDSRGPNRKERLGGGPSRVSRHIA